MALSTSTFKPNAINSRGRLENLDGNVLLSPAFFILILELNVYVKVRNTIHLSIFPKGSLYSLGTHLVPCASGSCPSLQRQPPLSQKDSVTAKEQASSYSQALSNGDAGDERQVGK